MTPFKLGLKPEEEEELRKKLSGAKALYFLLKMTFLLIVPFRYLGKTLNHKSLFFLLIIHKSALFEMQ